MCCLLSDKKKIVDCFLSMITLTRYIPLDNPALNKVLVLPVIRPCCTRIILSSPLLTRPLLECETTLRQVYYQYPSIPPLVHAEEKLHVFLPGLVPGVR